MNMNADYSTAMFGLQGDPESQSNVRMAALRRDCSQEAPCVCLCIMQPVPQQTIQKLL
jgi:hypothetical protein